MDVDDDLPRVGRRLDGAWNEGLEGGGGAGKPSAGRARPDFRPTTVRHGYSQSPKEKRFSNLEGREKIL